MKNKLSISISAFASCLAIVLLFTGCPMSEKSPIGFRLPEGNVTNGKAAFLEAGCVKCHSVDGVELASELADAREANIVLGGEISRVKTYGQLVTSIIYPSHIISSKYRDEYTDENGNSIMPDFTEEMTVRQMIDITEFLQAHYEVVVPDYDYYSYGP